MADIENKTSKSSIYQERDFLLDMTSCSLFMLAQATSIGNGAVVQRLLESKEQMNLFGEMIEILLTSLPNIYSSKSIEDSQIGQYKSLIMAMLSTFCNILADENGRNWFIESRSKTKIAKRLIEFKSLIKTESSEERLLRSIFANLKGNLDVIGLENEEINQIKKHF